MNANQVMVVLSFLVAGNIRNVAEGFSGGAPSEACSNLTPNPTAHQAPPQVNAPPYQVNLSALDNGNGLFEYEPGQTYTLTFQSVFPGLEFRGVFLQGRVVANDSVAGTFTATDPLTRLSSCNPANIGVTHNSRVNKVSITTEWTAPPAGTGPVSIGFGVVLVRSDYWGNQRSPVIQERATVATTESVTTESATSTTDVPVTTQAPIATTVPMTTAPATTTASDDSNNIDSTTLDNSAMGVGGDPHFSILLPTNKHLCYSVQGEAGFFFNLINNEDMSMNALFVADTVREEVTWIGGLGIVIKKAPYKGSPVTRIGFDASRKAITVGRDMTLKAQSIDTVTFRNGKVLVTYAVRKSNCSCFSIQVGLQDLGLNFSIHFVKNNHLDMKWEAVEHQSQNSHGIIGQFFRVGVDIDESRHLLILPGMEPVPVMRRPIWHFMERDVTDGKLCWVAMNPGYQGKKLLQGSYLDYVVDDLFSTNFMY